MRNKLFLLLLVGIFLYSCSSNKITIAISKASTSENYEKYKKAILYYDKDIEVVDLWSMSYDSAIKVISDADGLLLSGGPDVHPAYFGRAGDTAQCSIDLHRDTLEFELIKIAMKKEIPILGICRGLQILNVALGGSLIVDIPNEVNNYVVHQIDSGDAYHRIQIAENSILYNYTGLKEYEVNSNHHQAIDKLSVELVATSYTADNIIEAIEYKDKNKPFLLAVQWHPERMGLDSIMSKIIFTTFINEVKKNLVNNN